MSGEEQKKKERGEREERGEEREKEGEILEFFSKIEQRRCTAQVYLTMQIEWQDAENSDFVVTKESPQSQHSRCLHETHNNRVVGALEERPLP